MANDVFGCKIHGTDTTFLQGQYCWRCLCEKFDALGVEKKQLLTAEDQERLGIKIQASKAATRTSSQRVPTKRK